MEQDVRIKPHHFVDIVTSYAQGDPFKPHPYGHAVHSVAKTVLENPDVTLAMELGADDICGPCKYNINGLCNDTIDTSFRPEAPSSKREYNLLIDRRWCQRLGIRQGNRLTAREFCERLRDNTEDIQDIYRENPAERVEKRKEHLRAGIRKFLALPTRGKS